MFVRVPSIASSKRWVGGVRKWQFLMICSNVNHQRSGWMGLKKSKTWWRNNWMVPSPKYSRNLEKPHNWFCYLLPACHFGNPNIVKNYNMPDHEIFNHILTIQRSMSKVCTTKGSAYCYHPVSIAFLMSQFWFYSLFLAWLVTTKMLFPK